MSHLPIGIFDSGLGGLTIVKAVQELLPHEQVIYFGDTAHLPYGDKSPELIRNYAAGIARFLRGREVKAIVIACNTASAVALEAVKEAAGDLPVFDVISPAVEEAIRRTRNDKVGVIGTKTTIHSDVYDDRLREALPGVRVVQKATPLMVPMIEEGWLNNAVSQDVIDAYMSDTGFQEIDTLILGCTHYPLVKNQIEKYFHENYDHPIEVVDSSLAVAAHIREELEDKNLLTTQSDIPHHEYFLSDFTSHFQETAKLFLGKEASFENA